MVSDLELMQKWVTATKILSALLSILLIYVVLVRGFSFAYWNLFLDRGSGSMGTWQFYLNFYQITISFAFKIVLAIILLRFGRKFWNLLNDRFIPPYEKQTIPEPPLPIPITNQSYSMKRSLKMIVYFFSITVVLSMMLIFIDSTLNLLYSQVLQNQIRALSDQFLITVIAEIAQIPVGSIDTTPFEPESDSALFITIIHIWIPTVPLSLFLINFYSFFQRIIHVFLFRLFADQGILE